MEATTMHRPDPRKPATVWKFFVAECERSDFPHVSWALGSDWGMGSRPLTAAEYRKAAFARMERLYGANPNAEAV